LYPLHLKMRDLKMKPHFAPVREIISATFLSL
jgi:hypothetical protein